MESTLITTFAGRLQKARSVNQTSNGYVSKVPTTTAPVDDAGTATGQAVIRMAHHSGESQNLISILPYAAGSNNNTFSFQVYGWRAIPNASISEPYLWIPALLGEFACTVSSTAPGVANGVVGTGELFADTITQTYPAAATSSIEVVSNGADRIAHVIIDAKGSEAIEITFTTGGSATSCNALVSKY